LVRIPATCDRSKDATGTALRPAPGQDPEVRFAIVGVRTSRRSISWSTSPGDGVCLSGGAGGDSFPIGNPESFYLVADGTVTVTSCGEEPDIPHRPALIVLLKGSAHGVTNSCVDLPPVGDGAICRPPD
jgi:hypothetical protein